MALRSRALYFYVPESQNIGYISLSLKIISDKWTQLVIPVLGENPHHFLQKESGILNFSAEKI